MLRPSYFELSVIHRGTTTNDHKLRPYALSIAAILRSQVCACVYAGLGPRWSAASMPPSFAAILHSQAWAGGGGQCWRAGMARV